MKKTLLLMFSVVCIASASQSGAEIFKRCGVCHGDKGQKHSLNLTRFIAGMDKDEVVDILQQYKAKKRNKYGLGTMMQGQAARLSEEDIHAVATYISDLEPIKEEVVIKKVIDTTDGAKIFKKCSVCHGEKGHKRSLNVSKYIAGMKKEKVFEILEAYQSGKRNLYGYGSMMKGQAKKLSEKQKHSVAEYVETLEPFKEKQKNTTGEKRITKDEVTWNEFMRWYFDTSTDPNETFKAAKKAWEKRKADIKAGIPVKPIVTKRTLAEQHKAKLKERAYGDANASYKEVPAKERMKEIEKKIAPLSSELPKAESISTKEKVQKETLKIEERKEKLQNEVTTKTEKTVETTASEAKEATQETPKEEESSSWWSW